MFNFLSLYFKSGNGNEQQNTQDRIHAIVGRGYASTKEEYRLIFPESCPNCCSRDSLRKDEAIAYVENHHWMGGVTTIQTSISCIHCGHHYDVIRDEQGGSSNPTRYEHRSHAICAEAEAFPDFTKHKDVF